MCGTSKPELTNTTDVVTVSGEFDFSTATLNIPEGTTRKDKRLAVYRVVDEEGYPGQSCDMFISGGSPVYDRVDKDAQNAAYIVGYHVLKGIAERDVSTAKPGSKKEKRRNIIATAEKYLTTKEFRNHFFNVNKEEITRINGNYKADNVYDRDHYKATKIQAYKMIRELDGLK